MAVQSNLGRGAGGTVQALEEVVAVGEQLRVRVEMNTWCVIAVTDHVNGIVDSHAKSVRGEIFDRRGFKLFRFGGHHYRESTTGRRKLDPVARLKCLQRGCQRYQQCRRYD